MFIKSVFALYFAAVAIAAPQDVGGITNGTSCVNPCPLSTSLVKPTQGVPVPVISLVSPTLSVEHLVVPMAPVFSLV